jgi:hypothetical protein
VKLTCKIHFLKGHVVPVTCVLQTTAPVESWEKRWTNASRATFNKMPDSVSVTKPLIAVTDQRRLREHDNWTRCGASGGLLSQQKDIKEKLVKILKKKRKWGWGRGFYHTVKTFNSASAGYRWIHRRETNETKSLKISSIACGNLINDEGSELLLEQSTTLTVLWSKVIGPSVYSGNVASLSERKNRWECCHSQPKIWVDSLISLILPRIQSTSWEFGIQWENICEGLLEREKSCRKTRDY